MQRGVVWCGVVPQESIKPKVGGAKLSMAALMSNKPSAPKPQAAAAAEEEAVGADLGESGIARALLIQPFGAGGEGAAAAVR